MRRRWRKPAPRPWKKSPAAKRRLSRRQGKRDDIGKEKFRKGRNDQSEVGGELYRLHRRYAADHSWAGIAPVASGGGAPGHAGNTRHDPQSAPSCGSGGLSSWQRKRRKKRSRLASN